MSNQHDWVIGIVFGALGCGLLAGTGIGCAVGLVQGWGQLIRQAPGPKWSFESWASNITAAGGALGTVLAGTSLSSAAQPLDKNALVALNLFFGLLVLAGPLVFICIRNPTKSPVDPNADHWGFNITLLIACSLTFAAVVGELTTLAALYWEVLGGGSWGWTAVAVASAAGVIVLYYFVVTVWYLAGANWATVAANIAAAQRNAVASALGVAPAAAVVLPASLPRAAWKLP